MAKRWTHDEDAFLLTWYRAAGADYIASHNLGRPNGAGSRRMAALTKSGARLHFARMMLCKIEFESAAGREPSDVKAEMAKWEREEQIALCAMGPV